jgi:hypothetical protein
MQAAQNPPAQLWVEESVNKEAMWRYRYTVVFRTVTPVAFDKQGRLVADATAQGSQGASRVHAAGAPGVQVRHGFQGGAAAAAGVAVAGGAAEQLQAVLLAQTVTQMAQMMSSAPLAAPAPVPFGGAPGSQGVQQAAWGSAGWTPSHEQQPVMSMAPAPPPTTAAPTAQPRSFRAPH